MSFAEACETVRSLLDVETGTAFSGTRQYLDTRERHLLHRCVVFESDTDKTAGAVLSLRGGKKWLSDPVRQSSRPGSAAEIGDFYLRRQMTDLVGARELTMVGKRPLRYERMPIKNKDRKTTAWLCVEQFGTVGRRARGAPVSVRLIALQGYRKYAENAARVLSKNLALDNTPSVRACAELDHATAALPDCLMVQKPALTRETSVVDSVVGILVANFHVVRTREKGIEADLDIEYLHDFRIAIRRMRSVFGASDSLFMPEAAALLKPDLRWLNQTTGKRRDLDVYLYQMPELMQSVKRSNRAALREMYHFIAEERQREQEKLVLALKGKRYETFKADWSAFLEAPKPRSTVQRHDVAAWAGNAIWKTYKRIRRQLHSPRITAHIDALHTLRKDCKKLRYQIEEFDSIYPQKALNNAVGELKHLQDILGAVCDNSVQQRFLSQRQDHLLKHVRDPAQFEKLLDELLGHYAAQERRMLRTMQNDLDRFGSKQVMRKYRHLFKP